MIATKIKSNTGKKGFSLFESIVALTVMSVSFVAIFSAINASGFAINHKNLETQAILLAETKLAEIKLGKLTNYDSVTGKSGRFTWQVTIFPTDIGILGLITSKVIWLERNKEKKVYINTFVQMQNIME